MKFQLIVLATISLIVLSSQVLVESAEEDIRGKILNSYLNGPKKEMFKVFHFLFKKEYDLNSEEGITRYRIFKKTLSFIEETNAKNLSYTLRLNDFSDLSDEEFRQKYLNYKIDDNNSSVRFLSDSNNFFELFADAEEEINIVESNDLSDAPIDYTSYFGPAKDQGSCGSCWAFAAIGAIEANYAKQFGKSVQFAEQQLVDCSPYTNGCKGSDPINALKYITESGIAYQNSYKYLSGITKTPGVCQYNKATQNFVVPSTQKCNGTKCTRAIVRSLLNQGPVVALIDGEGNGVFKSYGGGIIDMTCRDANHAIIMAGLAVDPKTNKEYYIGRNSWGSGWGDKGFFKIYVRDSDKTCFMESYAVLPVVSESKVPVPPPPQPECVRLYSECNLKGTYVETCSSISTLNPFPRGFTIGEKVNEVLLYTGSKCSGSYYTLNSSIGCFSDQGINTAIQSIFIDDKQTPPSGCIWVFFDYCLAGEKVQLCSDSRDLSSNFCAAKISSIKFGPNVKNVKVYSKVDFYGTYSTLTSNKISFSGSSLDKNIRSIQIGK